MNTSVRARHDARGFSFIELLVTIIIAGIAFAALVPMFVGAQKAMAGDQLRNSALQLAQDKLEKVRGLDYDLITTSNLTNNTIPNGQFGTTVDWTTGGGGSRTFSVSYQVDLLPTGSAAGSESYKQVTITASWSAPPSPVKPVQLSTMVSKQYAGPQIVRFDVGPDSILGEGQGSTWFTSGPVVLDAYIAPDDIQSMNQSAILANQGYVLFTVTSLGGSAVASGKVTSPVLGAPAHYQFTWNNLAASAGDGIYIFQAVAVAGFGSRTQGMPVSLALYYTTHAPPAPTSLTVAPGDSHVYLNWHAPSTGDIDRYEIWRSTDGVTFAKVGQVIKLLPLSDPPVVPTSFEDTGLTNGVNYYYKVRTVDSETPALSSPFSAVVQTVPYVPKDDAAPSPPSPLTAVALAGKPTVRLSWAQSSDTGSPASGLAGYIIQRSFNGVDWSTLQSLYQALTYDDTSAGWSVTWRYRVQAVDHAGNASAYALAGPVTTDVMPMRTVTATNNSSMQTYVWVQNASTLKWYSTTGTAYTDRPALGEWVKKNGNGSGVWSGIPPGLYNVYFLLTQVWAANQIVKTQAVDTSAGNGTATYP